MPRHSLVSRGSVLGIDPSFRRTGLCLLTESGFLFDRIDMEGELIKDFPNLYKRSVEICQWLTAYLDDKLVSYVVLEYPPPVSQFSGGMYMLVTMILTTLHDMAHDVHLSPPAVSRNIFKVRKWTKTMSVQKVKSVITPTHRLCADEADAFLMCIPFMSDYYKEQLDIKRDVEYVRI